MMQKVGDVCDNCKDRWTIKGREPKVLQGVGKTMQKEMTVPVCLYCDGDALLTHKKSTTS